MIFCYLKTISNFLSDFYRKKKCEFKGKKIILSEK